MGPTPPRDSATGGRDTLAIVPAYNESECIAEVIGDLRRYVPDCDIVVVDDRSTDDTTDRVRACGAGLLRLPFNLGIGGAVQTGFRYARRRGYRYAFQFDGDGQHPADEVARLLGPLRAGEADVVIGSRFLEKKGFQSTALRRIGIRLFQGLSRVTSAHRISDTTSGFRAYNARAFSFLADDYPSDYPEVEAITLLSRRGFRIVEVPVAMRERQGGVSSISTASSLYYLVKVSLASLVSVGKRRG